MTITVRERLAPVTETRPNGDGVWEALPTGKMRTVYDVYLDDTLYCSSPDRREAEEEAANRAFMCDLVLVASVCGGADSLVRAQEGRRGMILTLYHALIDPNHTCMRECCRREVAR